MGHFLAGAKDDLKLFLDGEYTQLSDDGIETRLKIRGVLVYFPYKDERETVPHYTATELSDEEEDEGSLRGMLLCFWGRRLVPHGDMAAPDAHDSCLI